MRILAINQCWKYEYLSSVSLRNWQLMLAFVIICAWLNSSRLRLVFHVTLCRGRVQSLCVCPTSKQLVSAGDDGLLIFWQLDVKRDVTPAWKTADRCEMCNAPFFWNWRQIWDEKRLVVNRQVRSALSPSLVFIRCVCLLRVKPCLRSHKALCISSMKQCLLRVHALLSLLYYAS